METIEITKRLDELNIKETLSEEEKEEAKMLIYRMQHDKYVEATTAYPYLIKKLQ